MKIFHIFLGLLMVLCFALDAILVKNSIMSLNSFFFVVLDLELLQFFFFLF